ncbi:MAG TPA: hypothetical protein VIR16_08305 [Candidatus Limnocylindrales bacterium]
MRELHTTLGPLTADRVGLVLPHEHIFVDLSPLAAASYQSADPDDVVRLMAPELAKLQEQGVSALVECTPVGVGRRVDVVSAVSRAAQFPVVVATGIYREPWVPQWAHRASESALTAWMVGELTDQVEQTGVRAGWIKLSAGDHGITATESKILRAAARAGAETGAVIGSHTVRGRVVRDQLDILEGAGYAPERFIWIHAQADPDVALHREMAERGCWVEYDNIGSDDPGDDRLIAWILELLSAGHGDRLLLSQDRGWYDPAAPGGGTPRPYTYLVSEFLPKLREAGVDEDTVARLTRTNPFHAFSR